MWRSHLLRCGLRAQSDGPDLEDHFVSRLDHRLEPEGSVRRLEVLTGALGRRRWSVDDRARILEETLVPGAVVSEVARRHAWRRSSCLPGAAPRARPPR